MAENTYIIKGNDIIMGVGNITVPWGAVTSRNPKPEQEQKTYAGQDGDTETVVSWDERETCSIEILRIAKKGAKAADLPIPQLNDVIAIEDKNYLVTGVDPKYKSDEAATLTVELKYWPKVAASLTLPASPAMASIQIDDPATRGTIGIPGKDGVLGKDSDH